MPAPLILLLTHSADFFTIDRVSEEVARRGARPVRVDTDLIPDRVRLGFEDHGSGPRCFLDIGAERLDVSTPQAVWTRSFWPPKWRQEPDPRHRAACVAQTREMLAGFWTAVSPRRWISRPASAIASANKLLQHRLAREAGLAVPRTLVTNDADAVRRFFDRLDGRVVAKMLQPLSMSMGRPREAVYTSDLEPEHLDGLEELRFAPMIFQEKIAKRRELRVQYVAGELFAGALDASGSVHGGTDWRRSEAGETAWRPARVPAPTAERMRRLMIRLDLAAGAFDLIETPSGEHVFLEVNPLGEWGMLERDLELPISAAFARALTGRP